MYEGDAPLAERRAQALAIDRSLLTELLGQDELAGLLDPGALDAVEAELQATEPERRVRHADAAHDLLRRVGDLSEAELAARAVSDPRPWLAALAASHRAAPVRVGGEARWIAAEDVARYRDALGIAPAPGTPAALLAPVSDPIQTLVARWARTHGPFVAGAVAARFALAAEEVEAVLRQLAAAGQIVLGHFRPGAPAEWCDAEVMRLIRRRTLARLRAEVAPVEAATLANFLPSWQGVGDMRGGAAPLREAVERLEGLFLPFSDLEQAILPARVRDFAPAMLDELGALGELCWIGSGAPGGENGRVALFRRDRVRFLHDAPGPVTGDRPELPAPQRALLAALEAQGASFFAQLAPVLPGASSAEVLDALWDLVWAGLVTNDTFQPLRALAAPGRARAGGRNLAAQAAGRWSPVASLVTPAPSETEKAHARALVLLERYGVVSREAVAAEGWAGGFAAVAPVLRALEEAGKIRRGHFVEGLTGAQFAHAGAVERLRAARDAAEGREVIALAAVDPANPYGALLPWPEESGHADGEGDADLHAHAHADAHVDADAGRPRRSAGARVVLVKGQPALFVERGGHRLRVLAGAGSDDETLGAAVAALRAGPGRRRRPLRVERINGVPALKSALVPGLRRAGFRLEPGALVLDPAAGAGSGG
jgi:ATP-dependent Lhr-like helicase